MSSLVPYLVNAGVAGIVVVLMLLGYIVPRWVIDDKNKTIQAQKEQIDSLQHALELERSRSDAGVMAATVVKDVLQAAIRKEIAP